MDKNKIKARIGFNYNRFIVKTVALALGKKAMKLNHASVERYKPKTKKFIAVANHTEALDPVYLTMALGRYIRYVAGDHTIRSKKGWMYKYLAGVIIKHRELPSSVLIDEIKRNVAYGVPVGLFAEGAVTVNGQTSFISQNTGKLLRESGAALITYRFVGGYLRRPRWAPKARKGPITGYFVHEYSPEELKNLSDKEITDIIKRDIYVNAYEEQRKNPKKYEGENLAESVERVLYICPRCKKMCALKGSGNFLICNECGYKLELQDDGFFHESGTGIIFDNILDWDLWQREELKKRLAEAKEGELVFSDENQSVSKITDTTKREMLSEKASLKMYTDKAVIDFNNSRPPFEAPLKDIRLSFSGKDAVLIIHGENMYDIRCAVPRSSIKYVAAWRYLTGREYE